MKGIYATVRLCMVLMCSTYINAQNAAFVPAQLACELRTNPLGIDIDRPGLSYVLKATNNQRNIRQTAYQIIVSARPDFNNKDSGDLWNSGKVNDDRMAYINYSGKPLQTGQKCWWKVRAWNDKGNVSKWSRPAFFTMAVMNDSDWKASWISAEGAEKFALSPFGFKAKDSKVEEGRKWVQVDLEKSQPIEKITLVPMFYADRAGYGFPRRFKLEVSDDSTFATSVSIADYSPSDFENPHWLPVHFASKSVARFVRITALKFWKDGDNNVFALRQVEVLAGGKNIAAGKTTDASDSEESGGWSKKNLTDRVADLTVLPDYSSIIMRKEFAVKPALAGAVIFVSGLSQYELSINGNKVGDYLLSPGWTNYKKTVLYDTYDVTNQLTKGNNAIGIMLGNGMYNIQPDTVRYVKFLNSFGPAKAIAQLRLTYTDGSVETIGTDKSWKVAPGPVTYSNIFGGEDYNPNLEPGGWNKPNFKANKTWVSAIETSGPGGILKGLSCAAPPVKAIDTLQPVKITRIKENLWIYDYGQNASMMPYLNVAGSAGSYVRIIPSELLGKDGLADRASATQDGVRPAWWQYTLTGKGNEKWFPKFFYQGAKYLQVELFPSPKDNKLPKIKLLADVVVHSSSSPAGNFKSSNPLFNKIYTLVRWAQRSNMMSLMTDCPQREKLGWLEENHLNGPSLRYNFDMAPLFRKTMNDMADAQQDNGFIPNIAPEYFIAGPSDLSNGFRNSPEWGSSFIIVPWQQYLFSGDVSLLDRYYDRMKRYVSFLAASSKNHIISTGLGDWYDIGPKAPWGSQLTPVPFTATAVYYYDNWIMQKIAVLLGKNEDAQMYEKLSQQIKEAFNKEFFKPETGQYATGSQTCNAMPLFLNLVEPKHRTTVLSAVIKDVQNHNNSLTSGDVGYRFLLRALADDGRSDIIYLMNNQSEKPGYGYQLKMGATSLTEKWDAGVGSFGSQNHFMLGQINEWFFNNLAGIQPVSEGAGFRKMLINPSIIKDLKWVKGSFNSISGTIASEWKKSGNTVMLNISIPVNTSATVYVPGTNPQVILEGKIVASKAAGVKFVKVENGKSVYEVASGNYHFITKE